MRHAGVIHKNKENRKKKTGHVEKGQAALENKNGTLGKVPLGVDLKRIWDGFL